MKPGPNRRHVIGGLGATAALGYPRPAIARNRAKVVIIGGGFGGATAAQHLVRYCDVTLVEPSKTYWACPFSNLAITGQRDLRQQAFSYEALKKAGIKVIHQKARNINVESKTVLTEDNVKFAYDRLILSPGIDFKWDAIENYTAENAPLLPHAWKAGEQTKILMQQVQAMYNGGTFIIAVPPAPFRCPPGPYERVSLIAHYFKRHKPKSKILILDAQDKFSKMPLFEAGWKSEYGDMIERIPGSESGRLVRVDALKRTASTDFDTFQGDVVNVIPPQKAGLIAQACGATDGSGWCPINATTFESTLLPNVHVIGDATIAVPMPKSAFSANLQGKICALQIALMLDGKPPLDTVLTNTCYSYLTPDHAFSVSGVYHNKNGEFTPVTGAGGTSPVGEYPALRKAEAGQAEDWFKTITMEAFG